MKKIRIGNDFTVRWSIYAQTGGERVPYSLEGKRLILRLQSAIKTEDVTDFSVSENVIEWIFRGKDQKYLGNYVLILIENQDNAGMVTLDKMNAFCLVAHTEQETANDKGNIVINTISLESESAVLSLNGSGGIVDDKFNSESYNAIANKTVTNAFTEVAEALEGKQNTITDLDAIRSGASKGETALQSVPAEYVTETELNDKGYATTAQVAQKQDIIIDLDTIREGALKGESALQSIPSEYVTESELSAKGYATTTQVVAKQDKLVSGSNIKTINGQSIVGSGNIEIEGGGNIVVDMELSETSENPIANKAVAEIINLMGAEFTNALDARYNALYDIKQDKIEDLDTIRRGAAKGATALQSVPSEYVTTNALQTEIDLVETQIAGVASTIPTKTSQLNNDSGLATEDYVNQQVRNSIISALNTEV